MNDSIRILNAGGSFAAALLTFVLVACGGPVTPATDSGPTPDAIVADGGMDMPDANLPPDTDSGTVDVDAGTPEVDSGADGGTTSACTSEMMVARVSPPCDPDNNPEFGPGTGLTGLEGHVGDAHPWAGPSGSCRSYQSTDSIGRIRLLMGCSEGQAPWNGVFYYSADGNWYANWPNRGMVGTEGNHARVVINPDHTAGYGGSMYIYPGGSDTPSSTVPIWEM